MSVIRLVDRSNSRGLFEKLSSPKRILNHETHWEKEGGDNDIERRNERFDPLRFLGELLFHAHVFRADCEISVEQRPPFFLSPSWNVRG